ncbi:MAG: hypothetical protein RJA07_1698 [Bacteroidota bacterium]|jgi:hypothetical protein
MENPEKIAKEFIDKLFEKGEPRNNMCFATCLPLSILLTRNGIKNSLKVGLYKGAEEGTHFWISFGDNKDKELILDPTISQFSDLSNITEIIFDKSWFGKYFEEQTNYSFQNWFINSCLDLIDPKLIWIDYKYDTEEKKGEYAEKNEQTLKISEQVQSKILFISPILEAELAKLEFDESNLTEQEQLIRCRYNEVVMKLVFAQIHNSSRLALMIGGKQ